MRVTSLKSKSSILTDGPERAPNRSMLRAVGFKDADFTKPIVGVASTWAEVTPCNMHIDRLARRAKDVPRTSCQGLTSASDHPNSP